MDINQVRFGNYSIGAKSANAKRNEKKEEEPTLLNPSQSDPKQNVSSEDLFSAMNIAGAQNKSQINFIAKKEINPANYIDESRAQDIEAMMQNFDSAVESYAQAFEDEFPGMFSQEQKYALAANAFYNQG